MKPLLLIALTIVLSLGLIGREGNNEGESDGGNLLVRVRGEVYERLGNLNDWADNLSNR